jgi:hypothetical protein
VFNRLRKLDGITQSQTLLILGVVFLIIFAILAVPFYQSCKQEIAVSRLRTIHAQLVEASHRAFISTMSNMNEFDTTMPIDKFAQLYFTSQLPVEVYCDKSQEACWNPVQYKDLSDNLIEGKITYSVILQGGTVLGFSKNINNQISLIVDIDGKLGDNRLGRDVFVFYIYNSFQRPEICEDAEYEKYFVANGIHFGGFDRCGIPHDVYDYEDLFGTNLDDGCNKQAPYSQLGAGLGSACLALIKASDWTIDKIYPW